MNYPRAMIQMRCPLIIIWLENSGFIQHFKILRDLESNSQKENELASVWEQRVLITQQRAFRVMVKCDPMHKRRENATYPLQLGRFFRIEIKLSASGLCWDIKTLLAGGRQYYDCTLTPPLGSDISTETLHLGFNSLINTVYPRSFCPVCLGTWRKSSWADCKKFGF
jgi:hypothetical protein